jgi:type VI secretion system secreted protein VgrG
MDDEAPDELRPVSVAFLADTDEVHWEARGLRLEEGFNRPYELRVELETDDFAFEPARFLGMSVTVVLERGTLERTIHGIVASVHERAPAHDRINPELTIVPALMALDQDRTSRIFQDKSIDEILLEVLKKGLQPYEREVDAQYLSGTYPVQEYVVQYRESNLAFVERLMEEHGIGYAFTHDDATEKLVLFDSDALFSELVSFGNEDGVLPVVLRDAKTATREDIREFSRTSRLRPTVARTLVFDWLTPDKLHDVEKDESTELDTVNGAALDPEREDYEHDEPITSSSYRTDGLDYDAVEAQVKLRRTLHQRDAVRCKGVSSAVLVRPGVAFELFDHPQPDLDGEYFVVSVVHTVGRLSDRGAEKPVGYSNRFECLPRKVEWRPERRRVRPRIPSMQTAIVVGPAGEEIHTDEHGRIKVQFHWDRGGSSDENSSCFVRVLQPWAGAGWGSLFLPRIGMEVAVTFVDGDPERPMVTGCVYNGANRPPYALPDEMTKSTIKSNSSPGGGGANELRFEDAAGNEQIYLHAQKDLDEVVLNDHTTTVGNNQKNRVKANQTEAVDGNQKMTVGGDRNVHVKGDFEETIDGTETRQVIGDVTETFAANETRAIAGDQTEDIMGNVRRNIMANVEDNIGGKLDQMVGAGVAVTTPATYDVTAAGGIKMIAAAGMQVMAPGGFTVLAPGGTTTIDNMFDSIGGSNNSIFGSSLSITGNSVSIVGMANGVTGLKNEFTGISLSATGIQEQNTPIDLKTAKTKLCMGAIGLYMLGVTMFN